MSALLSYDHALERLLAALTSVSAQTRALAQAVGCVAAQDVHVAQPVPAQARALRDGYEMQAQEIAGASSYAPVVLSAAPRFVHAGDALSASCDCVVEASGVDLDGPLPQALVESFPGENIRRAGEDFAQGALLLRSGEVVSAHHALLLALAGVADVSVRAPVIALRGEDGVLKNWLTDQLVHSGMHLDGAPDLVIALGAFESAPQLALEPGREIVLAQEIGRPMIWVPARFDQAFAALHAFIWPALVSLSGIVRVEKSLPLAQKIASRVGVTELALFEEREGHFHLLALGDLPLQSLVRATHVSLIGAMSEGHGAGEMMTAFPVRA